MRKYILGLNNTFSTRSEKISNDHATTIITLVSASWSSVIDLDCGCTRVEIPSTVEKNESKGFPVYFQICIQGSVSLSTGYRHVSQADIWVWFSRPT